MKEIVSPSLYSVSDSDPKDMVSRSISSTSTVSESAKVSNVKDFYAIKIVLSRTAFCQWHI